MPTQDTIGDRIAQKLTERNMSQKELADQVGVTAAAINRYVTNNREPRTFVLARIADVLAVPIDWLIGRQTDAHRIPLPGAVELVARSSAELTQQQRDLLIDALFRKPSE